MRRILLTILAATCVLSVTSAAQDAPDLSGTWVMDIERSASAAGGHGPEDQKIRSETLLITQTADVLTVERHRGDAHDVIAYSFSPDPEPPQPRTAEPQPVGTSGTAAAADEAKVIGSEVVQARAERKEGRVITKVVLLVNGKTVTTDESLWLSADGRELIVERALQVHHGYQGAKAGAEGQDVYIRKTAER
jgi:hypothetical protein